MEAKMLHLVRLIVMPLITLGGFASLVFMLLTGVDIPAWFMVLVAGNIGWWFASGRDGGGEGSGGSGSHGGP